jgi:RimJ/RimL family protein N-acetyltransferase
MPVVLQTPRLSLRALTMADAPFVLEQLNEPSFIEFIADRGVRTVSDAEKYIREGPWAMYAAHGLGLLAVEERSSSQVIGMSGLLHRPAFEHRDLGYSLLPRAWGKGYAVEAGKAVLEWGKDALGLATVIAITSLENPRSIQVLERLGFSFEKLVLLGDEQVRRFTRAL